MTHGSCAALDLMNYSDSEEKRRALFDKADVQKYNTINFEEYLQVGLCRVIKLQQRFVCLLIVLYYGRLVIHLVENGEKWGAPTHVNRIKSVHYGEVRCSQQW